MHGTRAPRDTPGIMRAVPLLLLCLAAGAAELPPSPSTAPGLPLPPTAALTHLPGVIYPDESRALAFRLPPGQPGTIGWKGLPPIPVTPSLAVDTGGLLALPTTPGLRQVAIHLGSASWTFPVRLVAAAEDWTWDRLDQGLAVDKDGVPVILLAERPQPEADRRWQLLSTRPPRGADPALLVGDPLASPDGSAFTGLLGTVVTAIDARHPDLAVLVAISRHLGSGQRPKSLLWSPGNEALRQGAWSSEEERVLGVVKTRCLALGFLPRLSLLLPPTPLEDRPEILAQSSERRNLLRRSAAAQGWAVIDADRWCGPPEQATRLPGGGYATHPVGEARITLTTALKAELDR